jgi:hypothetical protein
MRVFLVRDVRSMKRIDGKVRQDFPLNIDLNFVLKWMIKGIIHNIKAVKLHS